MKEAEKIHWKGGGMKETEKIHWKGEESGQIGREIKVVGWIPIRS